MKINGLSVDTQAIAEPYCHTLAGKPVYNCFRYFNGVPHTMLATVEEHFTGNLPMEI